MAGPGSHILALDAALGQCSAALLAGGGVVAERLERGERGQAQRLAPMVGAVLEAAGLTAGELGAVAVTLGPGSFTGVRAALALAHGLALASGAALIGVSVSEALIAALPALPGRAVWVAIDSRRGRVFLDRGDGPHGVALRDLALPAGAVAVAGDAAADIAARLAAAGADVMLTDSRHVLARHVAQVAARRLADGAPLRPALPIYVDAPEAKLPAGGLRPAPLPMRAR